ncbi:la protein homolog [Cataglyphis hispanica]|uniref:la protein homolog n=1 Tax=Cataglyphis hispanica TaxID=1086592 RepID=UPI00217F2BFF|nr:la protein homolog [Cataglyphis hispanica]
MENGKEETSADCLNGDAVEEVNKVPTVDAESKNDEVKSTAEISENINAEVEVDKTVDAADNVSKEAEEKPSAELLKKIKEQIEYYFGNVNMQRDKFLIEQTKLDAGWIPMTVMLNFKMLAHLSKNVDVILKALESSDLIEISEDRKKIRRSPNYPLPEYNEEYRKAQEARTVYVKGFPLTSNIDKLKVFFEPYKPFETIVMRKYQDRKDKVFKFKGSVFVQFETLDDAKAFMNVESIKYEDTELIRKWAANYNAEKAQEREQRKKKATTAGKKEIEVDKSDQTAEADSVDTNIPTNTDSIDNKLPKGSIIYFSGVSKICTREDIKESLNKFDVDIAYIDFRRGDTEGWVRLQRENAAKSLLEKTKEGKVLINEVEVTCKVLEGEEEDKYLTKTLEEMAASKKKFSKGKRSGKKGRNARGAKRRNNSPTPNAVPAKKVALE